MKVMGITGFPPHSVNIFLQYFTRRLLVTDAVFVLVVVKYAIHDSKYLSFFTHRTARFGPEIWNFGCKTISHS
jgi:hypothetical protein